MTEKIYRMLIINTGSTSTKLAIYENKRLIDKMEHTIPMEELAGKDRAVEQLDYRTASAEKYLMSKGLTVNDLDIISARGGPIPPCEGGAYTVNALMTDVLTYAPLTQHESGLACLIGWRISGDSGVPVIIYDGVYSDELTPLAKTTGLPDIEFMSRGHTLNTRKVGREVAKHIGKSYADCNFIIAHFGGSITISVHSKGCIVDIYNAFNGPMSPQRAGMLPTVDMINICFSGRYTTGAEVQKLLNGRSGFMGYLGTQNAREVFARAGQGDELARHIVETMAYQCAKCISGLAAVTYGKVDRIIFTGGMAYSEYFTGLVLDRVEYIAPVEIMAGEFEMEALAEGALRVLSGQEKAKEFTLVPSRFRDIDDFYAFVNSENKKQPASHSSMNNMFQD